MGICVFLSTWESETFAQQYGYCNHIDDLCSRNLRSVLLLFRVVDADELYMLPGGTKLIAIVRKLRLLK